jgi:ketosteroid isomerase-like protein
MKLERIVAVTAFAGLVGTGAFAAESNEALEAKVRARETAFAKTMADRDLAAFSSFVAEEAIFYGQAPLRGRQAVVDGWKRFYEGQEAPFSWAPERVAVVASGTLAVSSGPVFDPKGVRTGTFVTTWRLDPDGEWRVVLDLGCPPCR